MSKYLVNGPGTADFLDLAHTESGTRAMLGDPKIEAMVGVDIVNAHIALREGAKKVAALVYDPTRTDVSKHAVAKKLADSVVEKLSKTKAVIEKRAEYLQSEALRVADIEFGPKSERAALHSEIRGWVRETLQRRGGEGIGIVREALKGNSDLAAIVWHSPRFLLGLPDEIHSELRMEVLEAHKPELFSGLSTSLALTKLLGKYDTAIRKVQSSFYSPEMAKQSVKRVEV
jgi:hypothetical protein